jgi:hypothetical protein
VLFVVKSLPHVGNLTYGNGNPVEVGKVISTAQDPSIHYSQDVAYPYPDTCLVYTGIEPTTSYSSSPGTVCFRWPGEYRYRQVQADKATAQTLLTRQIAEMQNPTQSLDASTAVDTAGDPAAPGTLIAILASIAGVLVVMLCCIVGFWIHPPASFRSSMTGTAPPPTKRTKSNPAPFTRLAPPQRQATQVPTTSYQPIVRPRKRVLGAVDGSVAG